MELSYCPKIYSCLSNLLSSQLLLMDYDLMRWVELRGVGQIFQFGLPAYQNEVQEVAFLTGLRSVPKPVLSVSFTPSRISATSFFSCTMESSIASLNYSLVETFDLRGGRVSFANSYLMSFRKVRTLQSSLLRDTFVVLEVNLVSLPVESWRVSAVFYRLVPIGSAGFLSEMGSLETKDLRVVARFECELIESGDLSTPFLCGTTFLINYFYLIILQTLFKTLTPNTTSRIKIELTAPTKRFHDIIQAAIQWLIIIINYYKMQATQKEDQLRRHLQGLFQTDRQAVALQELMQLAKWFVRETREEKFVKIMKGEVSRLSRTQSKTLIRAVVLIDKVIKQYKSFRQPFSQVIHQIFLELFSVFFQTTSIREMQQLKKMRKRWVTFFPQQVLQKIKTVIQSRFSYKLDANFTDKMLQQLKQYYAKQLKLTPQAYAKYLPDQQTPKPPPKQQRKFSSEQSYQEPQKASSNKRQQAPQPPVHKMQHPQPNYAMPPTHSNPPPSLPPQVPYGMPMPDGYHYGIPQGGYHPGGRYPTYSDQQMQYPGPNQVYMPFHLTQNMGAKPPNSASTTYVVYSPQFGGYAPMPPGYYMPPGPNNSHQYHPQQQPHPQQMDPFYQSEVKYQQPQYNNYPPTKPEAERKMQYMKADEGSRARSNPQAQVIGNPKAAKSSEELVHQRLKELRLGSYRCPTCGQQSSNRDYFNFHLQSHFQQKKKSYELSKKSNPIQRSHLLSIDDWQALNIKKEDQQYFVQMSKAADNTCKLCSNPFKPYWESRLEKWVYHNAVNVEMQRRTTVTLHYNCYQVLREQESPQVDPSNV